MIRKYKFWNSLIGWSVFLIATFVFVSTAEKSTSWWDCGEYITTASKLMVGHPSGAPTFQLLGAVFSIFAGDNPEEIAHWVNIMSALCSSFSILFLFWSITMLAKKLLISVLSKKDNTFSPIGFQPNLLQNILILGSGIVGALAYTFTDSFWFSAVEGEVYAMSSFFTAITFWAILKWEEGASNSFNLRWIVFIAFLIGLAIGVHLLNLLVIPAIVFTIYYKKFTTTKRGFWLSLGLSFVLLAGILWGIVPWVVKLAGYFELFFVNTLGLPFDFGTIFYFILLIGALIFGLIYTTKKHKYVLNTALLCICFILIGYSTFVTLVIRANADVPINQGENKDALSLLSYLNRDQYGSTPLVYGQYYTAKVTEVNPVSPQYRKDEKTGRYEPAGYSSQEVIYDPAHCSIFPRIWSNQESGGRPCITYNKIWSGKTSSDKVPPTMGENVKYLINYQIGWMYMRYFMWNFVGRQNDIMGRGYNTDGSRDVFQGNWISGIKPIDEMRLGPQDNLPSYLANNPSRNTFYFLPLLLGLAGLLYQYKQDRRNCFIVFLLFFMTGLAIVLYLNQPSTEPRERDYAFAGSFYGFAIWIGLGAMALIMMLFDLLKMKTLANKGGQIAIAVGGILLFTACVPGIMAIQGWDDHDRSNKTVARDYARNVLNSCEENAVLVSDGDNDTFPLWYCQNVEGIRPDIRLINSMLANSYWLIQPLYKTVYESKPFKFTLPTEAYSRGNNDRVYFREEVRTRESAKEVLKFVASKDRRTKIITSSGEDISFFPTRKLYLDLDKDNMLANGMLRAEDTNLVSSRLEWDLQGESWLKSNVMLLDLVVNNIEERPIYFISPYAHNTYLPCAKYSQSEGLVDRFLPYKTSSSRIFRDNSNGINTDRTYDLLMNQFTWGDVHTGEVSLDPDSRSWLVQARYQYYVLAVALMNESKKDSAIKVLDKGLYYFPANVLEYTPGEMLRYSDVYNNLGEKEKAEAILTELLDIYESRLLYVEQFPQKYQRSIKNEMKLSLDIVAEINRKAKANQLVDLAKRAGDLLFQRGYPV